MPGTKKALATVEQNKLTFTTEQVDLIKSTIAPNASNDELSLFLYQAQKTGLDPLARQIYFLKRKVKKNVKNANGTWSTTYEEKASIQASIDGFRVVAQRSGDYAGQDEPIFDEAKPYPTKCKVVVYKFAPNGQRYPAAVGVAYWEEYFPGETQGFMWKKMPHTMLAKVAEALALRKAFPQDLSGVYTSEEMSQAEPKQVDEDPERIKEGDKGLKPVSVAEPLEENFQKEITKHQEALDSKKTQEEKDMDEAVDNQEAIIEPEEVPTIATKATSKQKILLSQYIREGKLTEIGYKDLYNISYHEADAFIKGVESNEK